jgi:hypothetical protein
MHIIYKCWVAIIIFLEPPIFGFHKCLKNLPNYLRLNFRKFENNKLIYTIS